MQQSTRACGDGKGETDSPNVECQIFDSQDDFQHLRKKCANAPRHKKWENEHRKHFR